MDGFKNWLLAELKAIDDTIQGAFPGTPRWVQKDLFKDNWLKKRVRSGQSRTPLTDWLNSPQVQAFKNVTWPQKPACIVVRPDMFDDQTITDMIVRRFGKKPIDTRHFTAAQDKAKTDTQCDIMAKAGCNHVPIIMIRQSNGKMKMIEGWHRLMCRLVDGCPDELKRYLDDHSLGHWELMDCLMLHLWQPVKINAYVGIQQDTSAAHGLPSVYGRTPSQNSPGTGTAPNSNAFHSPTAEYIPSHDFESPTAPYIPQAGMSVAH
jgi:hypothetical protein